MILLIIFVFFLLAAFFSGMETGFISLKKYIIKSEAKHNVKMKKLLEFIESHEKIFGTTLLGTNISVVIVTTLAVYYLQKHPSLKIDENLFSLIIAGFLLVFSEIIPKAVFRDKAQILVPKYFPFLKFFYSIFKPFVNFITILKKTISKLFKINISDEDEDKLTFEDLSYIASNSKEVEDNQLIDEKEIVVGVISLAQKKVENVMTNRTAIVAIEENTPLSEVIKIANEHHFTRYPVYKNELDYISGILIIYDILNQQDVEEKKAKDIIREALFVPESINALSLLSKMKTTKKSMAIINDSFGGTAGIVTIQDLIEEFMGNIIDDDNNKLQGIKKIRDKEYLIDADLEIEEINNSLKINLPQGDYETIAGLIINEAKEIPKIGYILTKHNFKITVEDADSRKIKKVKLQILENPPLRIK